MNRFNKPHNWEDIYEDEWIDKRDFDRYEENRKRIRKANKILQSKITREDKEYFNEKRSDNK